MYQFRPLADKRLLFGTSGLMLPESAREAAVREHGTEAKSWATMRGSLVRLFGEPLIAGGVDDDLYLIEAVASDGTTWVLTACAGGRGVQLGGDAGDPTIYPVAEVLRAVLESTPPADFEVTYYAADYGTTVTYGCRHGAGYWYEARGRHPRVTRSMHDERQQQDEADLERYSQWCEATGSCFTCGGHGITIPWDGFDDGGIPILGDAIAECPNCAGSGKEPA